MTSDQAICALVAATKYIDEHPIPGDVVECGVWAGGSVMASKLAQNGIFHRDFWLFDTFEGMTPPSIEDGEIAQKAFDLEAEREQDSNWLEISKQIVQENIVRITSNDDHCNYVSGAIENTLVDPNTKLPTQIAILRIDTDWHNSTMAALENLFHLVSPGGVVILDDYGFWEGSRLAADNFFKKKGIIPFLTPVDRTTVFFQKSK
jgi:hypothetical protein